VMVAQSSCADHVILEGRYIPDVMGAASTGVLMVVGCDGMMPTRSVRYDQDRSWDQSGRGASERCQ